MSRRWNLLWMALVSGCSPSPDRSVVRLVDVFDESMVEANSSRDYEASGI